MTPAPAVRTQTTAGGGLACSNASIATVHGAISFAASFWVRSSLTLLSLFAFFFLFPLLLFLPVSFSTVVLALSAQSPDFAAKSAQYEGSFGAEELASPAWPKRSQFPSQFRAFSVKSSTPPPLEFFLQSANDTLLKLLPFCNSLPSSNHAE